MGNQIRFDAGVKEFTVNDRATIRFNPADDAFASKLLKTFDGLEGLQAGIAKSEGLGVLDAFAEADRGMRAEIDGLLGEGTSEAVFQGMSCYAVAGGLPIWCNFMLAILEQVAEAYGEEFEEGRSEKTMSHYRKRFDDISKKYARRK